MPLSLTSSEIMVPSHYYASIDLRPLITRHYLLRLHSCYVIHSPRQRERLCEPLVSDIVYSIKEVLRKSVEWVPSIVLIVLSSAEVR